MILNHVLFIITKLYQVFQSSHHLNHVVLQVEQLQVGHVAHAVDYLNLVIVQVQYSEIPHRPKVRNHVDHLALAMEMSHS